MLTAVLATPIEVTPTLQPRCWCRPQLAGFNSEAGVKADLVAGYIDRTGKWAALRRRYGQDKTFVVPILTNCALAGLAEWKQVPALPFEAAWLPQSWYRMARMPVVSYAIPALVAMGQAKFYFQPPRNPLFKVLRRQAIAPTLDVLTNMQPDSGGYLEAVPLTSFVLMSLAAIGKGELSVAQNCIRFLIDSRLNDGSWPIDTNLATWLTSLSVVALKRRTRKPLTVTITRRVGPSSQASSFVGVHSPDAPEIASATVRWLLSCQHQRRHAFTGAMPGGWGWTDLSGAVPDADDTPAALLALAALDLSLPETRRLEVQSLDAAAKGLRWLVELQNRDGGWPTFCRGWGKLPFDRSGTDLTAHALRAFHAWIPQLERLRRANSRTPSHAKIAKAMARGRRYLAQKQRPDGSWLALWFGNQDHPEEENPIYGTAKVLLAYADLAIVDDPAAQSGLKYLLTNQNSDGGWGGGPSIPYKGEFAAKSPGQLSFVHVANQAQAEICSSIEETALALEALVQCGGVGLHTPTIMRGFEWLITAIQRGNLNCSWPIGFYFAKLWYHERLYPAIFSLAALGGALEQFECDGTASWAAG
jgi:squalene-hopene/tetraprenyl-beta-curcumene cyclase